MRTVQIGHLTVPWPGDATPPGTRASAVRCSMVNVSIRVFVSDMYLFCRSDGVESLIGTLKVFV